MFLDGLKACGFNVIKQLLCKLVRYFHKLGISIKILAKFSCICVHAGMYVQLIIRAINGTFVL